MKLTKDDADIDSAIRARAIGVALRNPSFDALCYRVAVLSMGLEKMSALAQTALERGGREERLSSIASNLLKELEPYLVKGKAYGEQQAKKAKKPRKRVKIGGEGFSVTEKIQQLAKRKDELGDWIPPNDLWPDLFSWLEEKELSPEDQGEAYSYEMDDNYNRAVIKLSSFRTIIYTTRKKAI